MNSKPEYLTLLSWRPIQITYRTASLLFCMHLLLSGQVSASEYGSQDLKSKNISLTSVLLAPKKYTEKRIAIWGVLGGFKDATYIFLTSDHAKWRDLSNAVLIEPKKNFGYFSPWDPKVGKLFGQAVRIEGVLKVEDFGDEQYGLVLVVEHLFVPEDSRQTAHGEPK